MVFPTKSLEILKIAQGNEFAVESTEIVKILKTFEISDFLAKIKRKLEKMENLMKKTEYFE